MRLLSPNDDEKWERDDLEMSFLFHVPKDC